MTRTVVVPASAGDESLAGLVLPGLATPTGASLGVLGGYGDGAVVDAARVREMRQLLAGMSLPGATDSAVSAVAGVGASLSEGTLRVRAEWVDLLGELEALKNAVTATQARLAVVLDEATRADEAVQSIRAERRGRGVPNQVGAALRVSPHAGAGFLSTARVWVTQMPHTFAALQAGVLSPWRATLLVRETSHLSLEHRGLIDEEICGPAHLAQLARMGTRRLVARIKELAARLDVHACVNRNAKAVSERRVSVRPAPDLMVYLTALVPMHEGVQAYAQLKAHAEAAKVTGDERGAGQIMADTLIERVTGREPGRAGDVPVTINLLVSDQTLLTGGNEPGVVLEGSPAGVGAVPGPVARHLAAHAIETDTAWLRAIYVSPYGRLLATSSTSRFHPQGLAALLRAREQGICASSWCDAPVRHLVHVTPFVEGGPTSLDNGQGLCARCNHAKQAPGWRQKTTQIHGRDAVETVTPTGHTYVFVAPAPPTPVRAGRPAPHHGTAPTGGAVPVRDKAAVRDAPVHPEAAVTGPAGPVRDQASAPEPLAAPAWTPAVGMSGPSAGRTPRSRYQIGCHANPRNGPIAYRPGRRPGSGPPTRPQPRAPRRVHTADLSWAHRP